LFQNSISKNISDYLQIIHS